MQGSAIPPLSHRAPSAGGRYRFCGSESENDRTVAIGEGDGIFRGLMLSTFRSSKPSKPAGKVELVVQRKDEIELWVIGAVWIWQSSI